MEGIFRALGFGSSKPEYAEKIPENLKVEDFSVHKTFHHGFPCQPTCMDYDPIQQILAIGTESGAVLLLGKPGLEQYFKHPARVAVMKIQFIVNKGLLVTCCSDSVVYLWSLEGHKPKVVHKLEFVRENEKPSCISHSYKSDWLYVGSEDGNVYVVHVPSFVLSGFIIYWNQALGPSARTKPGHVLAVLEHPMDQGKILIAYNGGHCVLYNMKQHQQHSSSRPIGQPSDHKQFSYNPGDHHIVTSVSWANCGRNFACSYSNGSIALWNPKSETKPEKIFFLHESDSNHFKPIYKLQALHTDSDPMYVCSGGFPENSPEAPRTLTVMHGRSSSMLSCSSTIIDFMCLPSTPYACDYQKPLTLAIVAKNEVIFHDLSIPGYPKFPDYSLPYALDIHLPAVSCIHYSAVCPEEFIAQLHSVKSKMVTTFTKVWPLNGGRWGEEVPHSSTDIIITGHVDGSVRLWHCNSVIFQPFFTVDTSRYFKRQYSETPSPSSTGKSPKNSTAKSPRESTVKSPTFAPTPMSPSGTKVPPSRPPPPSHPPPKSRRVSEKNMLKLKSSSSSNLESPEGGGGGEAGEEVTPSPATGQVHSVTSSEEQDQTDVSSVGTESTGERIQLSHKEKFKKSKKHKGSSSSSSEEHDSVPHKKHSIKKSFHKMAKMVKTSKSSFDRVHSEETVDSEITILKEDDEKEDTSPSKEVPLPQPQASEEEQKTKKKRPPPRPSAIVLKEESQVFLDNPKVTLTPSRLHTPHSEELGTIPEGKRAESQSPKPPSSPQQLSAKSRTKVFSSQANDEEFFVVKYLEMSVCGTWLCVANYGGCVMAFNFYSVGSKQSATAGYLDINFDYNSIKKQYLPGTAKCDSNTVPSTPWIYDSHIKDSSAGYQLTQLCSCYYTDVASDKANNPGSTPSTPTPTRLSSSPVEVVRRRMPVVINQVQYSISVGLLALATGRGFAMVDTRSNTCVYTLNCCTSILYLSDPSKFASQMKRESKQSPTVRPSIRRYNTSIRFNDNLRPPPESSRRRIQSDRDGPGPSGVGEDYEAGGGDSVEVSVEMESCVSALELVQLQMDKLAPPMLTLWVGLASGYVAAYGVNMVAKTPGAGGKRIELVPTKLIIEMKSPMVNMFFLNEWGDRQVVPYKINVAMSGGKKEHQPVQRRPSQSPLTCPSTQHYAIFVDEQKMKSFSFPGLDKINAINLPLTENHVILRSQYFTCSELPCLATITSCQKLHIHCLPGLKPLFTVPLTLLGDPQAMGTFSVSGSGHGLYLSSLSEIQRISIVKEDMLNFPECLPVAFTRRADVGPSSYGKGFLGALFSAGPTTVNREEIFGAEAARHAIGNVARVDGHIVRPYGSRRGKEPRERDGGEGQERPAGERSVYRKGGSNRRTVKEGGGLSGQMNRNLTALDERKKKLGDIEDRTAKVADEAASYADLAAQLARKYGGSGSTK